jgi:hypothetical protein
VNFFIFSYDHESFRVFKTSSTLDLVSSMIFVAHLGQQVSPTKSKPWSLTFSLLTI